MKVEIGKDYKTYGGWVARVIWVPSIDLQDGFYAVHFPQTAQETVPIYHYQDGTAHSIFSVNEPPVSSKHHPADIVEGEVIQGETEKAKM